jgi:hypothetical protein
MGSDDGYRHARRILLYPFDQIQAVAVWQLHVCETEVELLGFQHSLCCGKVARGARAQVHALEGDGQQFANVGFIVDYENCGFGHDHIVARRELLFPALRIAKNDAKQAAVATAWLVQQNRTIQLAQFAGDE